MTTPPNAANAPQNAPREHEIILDTGRCSGCLGCVGLNPDIFDWDDTLGLPTLKRDRATAEEIHDALVCCPKQCISLGD